MEGAFLEAESSAKSSQRCCHLNRFQGRELECLLGNRKSKGEVLSPEVRHRCVSRTGRRFVWPGPGNIRWGHAWVRWQTALFAMGRSLDFYFKRAMKLGWF